MTDIRGMLDGIEKRAVNGPVSDWDPRGGDEPHHRVIERTIRFEKQLRADNASLVAALRAVLDKTGYVLEVAEEQGDNDFSGWAPEALAKDIQNAVTEALGGGA